MKVTGGSGAAPAAGGGGPTDVFVKLGGFGSSVASGDNKAYDITSPDVSIGDNFFISGSDLYLKAGVWEIVATVTFYKGAYGSDINARITLNANSWDQSSINEYAVIPTGYPGNEGSLRFRTVTISQIINVTADGNVGFNFYNPAGNGTSLSVDFSSFRCVRLGDVIE